MAWKNITLFIGGENLTNNTNNNKYIGFWKRVLASLLDVVILIPLAFILFKINIYAIRNRKFWLLSIDMIIYTIYYVYFISTRGGTPGKLIIKISVVNEEGMFLSPWKAILRYSPGIVYNILGIVNMYISKNSTAYYGFKVLCIISGLFFIVDVLIVPFNEKRRAIHDYFVGSYVVSKESIVDSEQPYGH